MKEVVISWIITILMINELFFPGNYIDGQDLSLVVA